MDGEEIALPKSSDLRSCRDIDALAPNDIEMSSCSKSHRAGRPGHRWGQRGVATSASFPPLMFFVHALLSFVGVVVIPTRLSYEVLLGPSEQDALSATITRWTGLARPDTHELGATFLSGAKEPRPELLTSFRRQNGGVHGESTHGSLFAAQGPSEGAYSNGHNTGYGGRRVLSQTDDEEAESYTYSSVTTFSLCFVSDYDNEDVLKSALEELFADVSIFLSCVCFWALGEKALLNEFDSLRGNTHKTVRSAVVVENPSLGASHQPLGSGRPPFLAHGISHDVFRKDSDNFFTPTVGI